MAQYVQYVPDVFAEQDIRGVHVWWFPEEFSQSRLGDRVIGSNACTLIAVLLAGRIDEFRIKLWGYLDQPLSRMLITSLAEAIVEGNEIHETLRMTHQLININLNVPEAIHAVQHTYPFLTEWSAKSVTMMSPLGESFVDVIEPPLFDWMNNPPYNKRDTSDLFVVLVADTRSVLFIYQPQLAKISMVDSHNHVERRAGAVVAQSHVGDLSQLCTWFCQMCLESFGRGNTISPYELAFLYIQDPYV